jgi:predicted flap endonuclease-1-like 5' DNA nuclease
MSTFTMPRPDAWSTVAVGAAVGAVAGGAVLLLYAGLTSKALAAAWAVKAGTGLKLAGSGQAQGPTLVNLLLPAAAGAGGGGAAGAGLVRGQVRRQLRQALNPLREQVEGLAEEVTGLATHASQSGRAASPPDAKPRRRPATELEQISGIGPTFARLLADGGLVTLNDLAQTTPETITALIRPSAGANTARPEQWIAEAARLRARTP